MKYIVLFALVIANFLSFSQTIVPKKVKKIEQKILVEPLAHANALVYLPKGYERIVSEKNANYPMYSDSMGIDYATWKKQQIELRPEAVFEDELKFKNGDIFITHNYSNITLSDFFNYQSSGTVEAQRALHKYNFINHPHRLGPGNTYTLLEDVNAEALSLINADSVFIYNSNKKFNYKSEENNYGSIVVNLLKFDLARISLIYYYPLGQEKKVYQEIAKNWGIIQFKPDREFTLPDKTGWLPKRTEPDLYMGKFAFINNPEQVKREQLKFEQKKANRIVDSLVHTGIAYFNARKLGDAKRVWQQAIVVNPKNPFPYAQMTFASAELKQRDSANFYWEQYKERTTDTYSVSFLKGQLLKRLGDLNEAAELYEALSSDSLHLDTYSELGSIYGELNLYDKAVNAFERGLVLVENERAKAKNKKGHRRIFTASFVQYKLNYAILAQKNERWNDAIRILSPMIDVSSNGNTEKPVVDYSGLYGNVSKGLLAECHFVLGTVYGRTQDEANARFHWNK